MLKLMSNTAIMLVCLETAVATCFRVEASCGDNKGPARVSLRTWPCCMQRGAATNCAAYDDQLDLKRRAPTCGPLATLEPGCSSPRQANAGGQASTVRPLYAQDCLLIRSELMCVMRCDARL